MKTFKPTSSFGASLLEALPPIPQSAPTTPALGAVSSPAGTTGINGVNAAAGLGLGANLGSVSSPTIAGASGVGAPAGVGLGASFGGSSSPTIGGGTGASGWPGFGSSLGLGAQPTGFPTTSALSGGLTAFGGSSGGVGLRPQATGLGVGAGVANPFRASIFTPGVGASAGGFPAFGAASANASTGLFSQPTGAPSFGQSLFVGAPMDASKQQNGAASLI
jgi:hypothetical protein